MTYELSNKLLELGTPSGPRYSMLLYVLSEVKI